MARVEKLQIQGFRSFGADDHDPGPQKIDFVRRAGASPLTLILGQNGCGKTTIIECLRYVSTGDCPPGSFGGRSFVHDPKMAREAIVTANVKLQFVGQDKDKYVVSRSMEATQKAKNITVKTLDSSITRRKAADGSTSTLSMKCADINTQIFHALGVSKPILNYVIFCHQEESNWPLDEGSKVKDKFDEIFASAKYKDCLKRIKDVRAEQKKVHMDLKKDIEYLWSDKKLADEKKKDLRTKTANQQDLLAELQSIDEQLEPIRNELIELNEVEKNFSGIQERITKAKTSLEHCQREMRELKQNIAEIISSDISDEEIEEMKSALEGQQQEKREKIDELKSDLRRLVNDRDRCVAEMEKVTSKIGECRGLRSKFERDKKDLSAALVKTGAALGWDVDESSNPFERDSEILDAIENIKDTVANLEDKLRTSTEKSEADIEDQSAQISRLEIQQAQLDEQKKMKTSEMIKMKREVASIKRQLGETDDSAEKLEEVKRQLVKKEKDLEDLNSRFDREDSKATTKRLKAQLSELERSESKLKSERSSLDAQREISSEIGIKKSDLEDKERKVERILSKNCTEFSHVFEGEKIPETSRLKSKFNERLEKFSSVKRDLEKEIQRLKAEANSKRDHRKTVQQDVVTKEDRLKKLDRQLEEVIPADQDFDEALSTAKSDVDKARLELQVKEANKFTYQEFIERIQTMQTASRSKPSCPTCNRAFEKESEVQALLDDLESEIKKIPGKVQNLQAKLKRATIKQDKLQAILPDKKRADELRREIDEKRTQLSQIEKEIKKCEEILGQKEDLLEVAEVDYAMCENLREDVVSVDRFHADVVSLSTRIRELTNQCPDLADARDYDTVMSELEDISRKISSCREELESNQEIEMQFEKKLNELGRQKNELVNEKLSIERRHIERVKMESKKIELDESVQNFESALVKIEAQLRPLSDEIRESNLTRSRLIADRDKKAQDFKQEIEKVKKFQNQVQSIQKQVNDYINSTNESTMTRLLSDQEKLSAKRQGLDTRCKTVDGERLKLEEELSQQSTRRRHFDDNIRLRNYLKDEKKYEKEKANYEDKLERLDYGTVRRKRHELATKHEALDKNKSEKKGRLSEMENSIRDLERELNTDKLKNAEAKHREKSVEARCRQHAINDLNKYYIALNWAIMRFHQERMSQINKIIRELWRATYKGNDIDYIEIKTDDIDEPMGADKRKVCNYRVIMVKNETEMEMRGRCSAGQKVLASLIIRLALAETFSSALGMIALDEPTTNLDRENIESLASALSDLVTKHSAQNNFQLIVITHDEDLIDLLSRVDQVDHYFKVSRNDRGLSIIRKMNNENR